MAKNQEIEFSTALQPAEIKADFDAMAERLDKLLEPYKGVTDEALDGMELKEIESCHADVNAIITSVEDGRKAVKKVYNAPLEEFERKCKELLEPARKAKEQLAASRDRKKAAERATLLEGLRNTYMDAAPILADVVPFERILEINPKWANKSYGAAKAANEIVEATAKIARDWTSLKSMKDSLSHYQEAEREFFRTLDLAAAIAFNEQAEQEQMRIDRMKAEVDENAMEQAVAAVMQPAAGAARSRYVIKIECTEGQLMGLLSWLKGKGISGTYSKVGEVA